MNENVVDDDYFFYIHIHGLQILIGILLIIGIVYFIRRKRRVV